jgi:hypothetical protein
MGLDMYLKAKQYTWVSAYENEPGYMERKHNSIESAVRDIALPKEFDTYGTRVLSCTAMYWRKANQIHKWFVDNVQNGEDDCGSYYVSIDDLKALVSAIDLALANTSKADEVLPTEGGFFFGGIDYDEWYWQDLEYTKEKISAILAMPDLKDWSFEYQSSW